MLSCISYKKLFLYSSLFCALISATANQLRAEDVRDVEPFAFRTEPANNFSDKLTDPFNYKGEPIAVSGFRIWPNLTLEQEYTDNVLAIDNDTKSDFITVTTPSIEISKDIGRHNFNIIASSEFRKHWDRQDDDVFNHSVLFNGNLEAKRGLDIPIKLAYEDTHLKRTDQRRANQNQIVKTPLGVKLFEAESGIVYKPNRLSLSLLGKYKQIRPGNESLINGGFLRHDNRDVNISEAKTEISYDLSNSLTPFIRSAYSHADYTNEGAGTTSRNNDLIKTLVGAKLNYNGLFKGFFGIGLENRSYDDSAIKNTNNLSFDTAFSWEPTAKTKFSFDANRSTYEDTLLTSALTETSFGFNVDQEFREDIFGHLGIRYEVSDFDELNRKDHQLDTSIEILKIINPHLQIGGAYYYTTRDSSVPGLDLKNNAIVLRIKTAL